MNIKWYHFFIFLLPLQLISLIYMVLIRQWFPETSYLEVLLSSMAAMIVVMWTQKRVFHPEKRKNGPFIRNMILFEIPLFFILKMVSVRSLTIDFDSIASSVAIAMISSVLCSFLTVVIYYIFLFRDHFYAQLMSKGEKKLKDTLRNQGYYLGVNLKYLEKVIGLVRFSLFFSIMLSFLIYTFFQELTLLKGILLFVHLVLLLFWNFHLKVLLENDSYLVHGILMEKKNRKGEGKIYLILALFASVGGLVLSLNHALLPWQWLQPIFDWFKNLFKKSSQMVYTPQAQQMPDMADNIPMMDILDMGPVEQGEPFQLSEKVQKILLIIGIALLVIALLYFLSYPLIQIIKNKKKREKRSKKWFPEFIRKIKEGISAFFQARENRNTLKIVWNDTEEVQEQERQKKRHQKPEDPKVRKTMIHNFIRLCRWGKKKGYPYFKGWGPEDNCRKLGDYFPDEKDNFNRHGLVFQEYFYSSERPSRERINELHQWLKALEKRRRK